MAPIKEYEQVIRETKVAPALASRQESLVSFGVTVGKLKQLNSQDTVAIRRFTRLETEMRNRVEDLRKSQNSFVKLVLMSEPSLIESKDLKADIKDIDGQIEAGCDILDELRDREDVSEGLKASVPDPVPIDFANVLNDTITQLSIKQDENLSKLATQLSSKQDEKMAKLVDSLSTKQDANTEKLVKSNSSHAPKPTQPFFTSKQNDSDFSNFKDFWSRFEFFTKKCSSNAEKLEWLKSSIKGDAYQLIKHLSVIDANYDVAVQKLNDKYSNADSVKHSLLQSILNFK